MKLTPQHIENQIASEQYLLPAGTLTICVLTLLNGIKVVGQSACLDEATFNEETGRELARKDAVGKIWGLEGYLAASQRGKGIVINIEVDATKALSQLQLARLEAAAIEARAAEQGLPYGEVAKSFREAYEIGRYYGYRDGYLDAEEKAAEADIKVGGTE